MGLSGRECDPLDMFRVRHTHGARLCAGTLPRQSPDGAEPAGQDSGCLVVHLGQIPGAKSGRRTDKLSQAFVPDVDNSICYMQSNGAGSIEIRLKSQLFIGTKYRLNFSGLLPSGQDKSGHAPAGAIRSPLASVHLLLVVSMPLGVELLLQRVRR